MLGRLFAGLRADPDQDESYTLNLLFPGLKQLPTRDFNPNLHLRVLIAHDTFTQRCRQPLYDSQPQPTPPSLKKRSYKDLSSSHTTTTAAATGSSHLTTAGGGSAPPSFRRPWSQSPPILLPHHHNQSSGPPTPSPLLWPASYIRLAEYIFGSVPVSYSGSVTKLYPIPVDSNSLSADPGRLCFLVVRIFSVPPGVTTTTTNNTSTSTAAAAAAASHKHSYHHNTDWNPHPSPGDDLPRASGRSSRFAIAAILSLPQHDEHLLVHNWRDVSRAIGELERIVYFRISSSTTTNWTPLTPNCLQEDSTVIQACSYFSERLTSSFCALRLVCGQARWREWSIALRAANTRIYPNNNILFLATTITLFTLYNSALIDPTELTETPFVILSSDANLTRRIIFILTSMITTPGGDGDDRIITTGGSGDLSSYSSSKNSCSPTTGLTLRPVSSSSVNILSPSNSITSYCSSNEDIITTASHYPSTMTPRSLRRIANHGWDIPRDRRSTSSLRSTLSGTVLSTSYSDGAAATALPARSYAAPGGGQQIKVSFPGKPSTNVINNNSSSRMLLSNALASLIGKTTVSDVTTNSSAKTSKSSTTTPPQHNASATSNNSSNPAHTRESKSASPGNIYPELPKVEYEYSNDSIIVPHLNGDTFNDTFNYQPLPRTKSWSPLIGSNSTPRTIRSLRKVVMTNNLQSWNEQQSSAKMTSPTSAPVSLMDAIPATTQQQLAVPELLPQFGLAVPYAGYRPRFSLNFNIQGCAKVDDEDIKRAILQDIPSNKVANKNFLHLFGHETGMDKVLGEYIAINPDNRRISMYRVIRNNQGNDDLIKNDLPILGQYDPAAPPPSPELTSVIESVSKQLIQLLEDVPYNNKNASARHQQVMHDTSSVEDQLQEIISCVLDFLHTQ